MNANIYICFRVVFYFPSLHNKPFNFKAFRTQQERYIFIVLIMFVDVYQYFTLFLNVIIKCALYTDVTFSS